VRVDRQCCGGTARFIARLFYCQLGKFRTALEIDCCAGAAVLTLPVSGQCSRTEQRKKLVAGAPL
jgi:hypothetical protein